MNTVLDFPALSKHDLIKERCVAAKIWIGARSRAAHLRRLSVVFAVELRLKIVSELYMREMSPKQFYDEFGGGSLPRVTQNFEKLVEHGWLRYVRSEGPGGGRRGCVEHFYRATDLAFFDPETWALLPYSIRVAFSWNTFKQIAARLREAIEAGTFDARPGSGLWSRSLLLDPIGWERVIEAVNAQFVALFEEQEDARLRMSHSGETPIRASVIQIAFESPCRDVGRAGPALVESEEPLVPFPVRLSKVFADEVCLQIVDEANRRAISAMQFHGDHGGDLDGIRRRIKRLAEIGWLKQVAEKTGGRRRGATEKFYRATGPTIFGGGGPWSNVPDALQRTGSWRASEQLFAHVKEAMEAGTFDARKDGCLAWSLLQFDQRGWERVTTELDALLAFALEEGERAKVRIRESGEEPTATTVAFGAFESPKELERES